MIVEAKFVGERICSDKKKWRIFMFSRMLKKLVLEFIMIIMANRTTQTKLNLNPTDKKRSADQAKLKNENEPVTKK
jgi:hypothetical protein